MTDRYMLTIRTGEKSGWRYYGWKESALYSFESIQRGEWPTIYMWGCKTCTINPAQVTDMRMTPADDDMREGWFEMNQSGEYEL